MGCTKSGQYRYDFWGYQIPKIVCSNNFYGCFDEENAGDMIDKDWVEKNVIYVNVQASLWQEEEEPAPDKTHEEKGQILDDFDEEDPFGHCGDLDCV